MRHPGRVADEEHRGRDSGVGEDAAVVSGSGAKGRYAAEPAGHLPHQGVVEVGRGSPRFLAHLRVEVVHDGGDVRDDRLDGVGVGAAGVEPAGDGTRDGVDAAGDDGDLADGGDAPVGLGGAAGRDDGGGEPDHRVLAVLQGRRAGVVGLAGDVDAPAPMGPDVAADADGGAAIDEVPALFDVEFDEGANAGEGLGVWAEGVGVATGVGEGLGHGDPVAVPEGAGPVGVEHSGEQSGTRAGDPEPRALFVDEVDDGQGPVGAVTPFAEDIDGEQAGDDTEGTIEGPAIGHRIQMRPGDDGLAAGPGSLTVAALGRRSPPGPLVADAVFGQGQPTSLRLRREPVPQLQVGAGPGIPAIAPRLRPPDRLQFRPEAAKGGSDLNAEGAQRHTPIPPCLPLESHSPPRKVPPTLSRRADSRPEYFRAALFKGGRGLSLRCPRDALIYLVVVGVASLGWGPVLGRIGHGVRAAFVC